MLGDDLAALLVDARLVLSYAVRAGKLPDDALAEAISRFERLEPGDTADVVGFQRAMSAAVAAIAPMSITDLRAGRSPFDIRNIRSRKRWQVGLSVFTFALILGIAYCQYLLQQYGDALQGYLETRDARASEKITAARKIVQRDNALDEASCSFDDYQRARHDLRKLADKTVNSFSTLQRLAQSSPWPFGGSLASATAGLPSAHAASAVGYSSPVSKAEPEIADMCDPRSRPEKLLEYPKWLRQVVFDSVDEVCFATNLNVDVSGLRTLMDQEAWVPTIQQRLDLETKWLLPFFYGLLGACIYVMRRLLFDSKGAVFENMVIVLRLALGALAGVVISWFAVPGLGNSASASALSSLPYMLAFLAGFSIDNLFVLLDRANNTLSGRGRAAEAR